MMGPTADEGSLFIAPLTRVVVKHTGMFTVAMFVQGVPKYTTHFNRF